MKPATRKEAAAKTGYGPLVLRLRPVFELDDDRFFELSGLNRDLRLEMTAEGGLIVMPPTGWETANRNAEITMQLRLWAKREDIGVVSDSSAGFRLPNGSVLSPDASWIERSRLVALTDEQRKKFLPLYPDFVVELRSSSDNLRVLQDKMREYIENGARLGWLIDPEGRRVYVYRPDAPIRELEAPETLSGDPVLSGYVLDLREIW